MTYDELKSLLTITPGEALTISFDDLEDEQTGAFFAKFFDTVPPPPGEPGDAGEEAPVALGPASAFVVAEAVRIPADPTEGPITLTGKLQNKFLGIVDLGQDVTFSGVFTLAADESSLLVEVTLSFPEGWSLGAVMEAEELLALAEDLMPQVTERLNFPIQGLYLNSETQAIELGVRPANMKLFLDEVADFLQGVSVLDHFPVEDFPSFEDAPLKLGDFSLQANFDPLFLSLLRMQLVLEGDAVWNPLENLIVFKNFMADILLLDPVSQPSAEIVLQTQAEVGDGEIGALISLPSLAFQCVLAEGEEINLKSVMDDILDIPIPMDKFICDGLAISGAPEAHTYSFSLSVKNGSTPEERWEIIEGLSLEGIQGEFTYITGPEGATSGSLTAFITLGSTRFFLSAAHAAGERGWLFSGGWVEDTAMTVSAFIDDLAQAFGLTAVPREAVDEVLGGLTIEHLKMDFHSGTKDLHFACHLTFTFDETPSDLLLYVDLVHMQRGHEMSFSGDLSVGEHAFYLDFTQTTYIEGGITQQGKTMVAGYAHETGQPINLVSALVEPLSPRTDLTIFNEFDLATLILYQLELRYESLTPAGITRYGILGAFGWKPTLNLDGSSETLVEVDARVDLTKEVSDGASKVLGTVCGTIESPIDGLEFIKVGACYELGESANILTLQVTLGQVMFSGAYNEGDKFWEFTTAATAPLTLGDIATFFTSLVDPTIEEYEFEPPWSRLAAIDFGQFLQSIKLVWVQNSVAKETSFGVELDIPTLLAAVPGQALAIPDEIKSFLDITKIGFSYSKNSRNTSKKGNNPKRVELSIEGKFLGFRATGDKALRWDPLNDAAPEVPGKGAAVFDIQYLGIGQHVAVNGVENTESIGEIMGLLQGNLDDGQVQIMADRSKKLENPMALFGAQGGGPVRFNAESQILVGAEMTLLRTVLLRVIFNDPLVYGVRLELFGPSAKVLAGLKFEILYRKVNDTVGVYHIELTLPDAMRFLQFGTVSVTIPIIVVDIYTNGDFKLDFGYPWRGNWRRSLSVQVFPFMGSAGFYFNKLSAGTATSTPAIINGTFTPVIEFGFALKIGLGKSFNKGPVEAEASISVKGTLQGVISWFNPDEPGLQKEQFYRLAGSVAIVARVYGKIDFVVIKIELEVKAEAGVRFLLEVYQPIFLEMYAEVTVKAKATILGIKTEFSHTLEIEQSFTIGQQQATPWKLGTARALSLHTAATRSLRTGAFVAQPMAASALAPEIPATPMAAPQALASFAFARGVSTTVVDDLSPNNIVRTLSPSLLNWTPVHIWKDEKEKEVLELFFQPGFTRVGTAVHGVSLLFIRNTFDADPAATETEFDQLMAGLLAWAVHAYHVVPGMAPDAAGGPPAGSALTPFKDLPVSKDILSKLYDSVVHQEEDPANPFTYEAIIAFLRTNFEFHIVEATGTVSGTWFPIFPQLTMALTGVPGTIGFDDSATVLDTTELDFLRRYFGELQLQVDPDGSGNPGHQPESNTSLNKYIFKDYFNMLIRTGLQEAIAHLDQKERDSGSADAFEITLEALLEELNASPAYVRAAAMASRNMMHGMRFPFLGGDLQVKQLIRLNTPAEGTELGRQIKSIDLVNDRLVLEAIDKGAEHTFTLTGDTEYTGQDGAIMLPNNFAVGDWVRVVAATSSLYEQSHQQFLQPTHDLPNFTITLNQVAGAADWVKLIDNSDGAPSPTDDQIRYELTTEAQAWIHRLKAAPDTLPEMTPELLPFYDFVPQRYPLTMRKTYQEGGEHRTLLAFPEEFRDQMAINKLSSLEASVWEGRLESPGKTRLAPQRLPAYSWATQIPIQVNRIPGPNGNVAFIYSLEGPNLQDQELLEEVLLHLAENPGETLLVSLIYADPAGEGDAFLNPPGREIFITKSNLSIAAPHVILSTSGLALSPAPGEAATIFPPASTRLTIKEKKNHGGADWYWVSWIEGEHLHSGWVEGARVRVQDPEEPTFARLSDGKAFLQLLAEASAVSSSGYYLYHARKVVDGAETTYEGLPDEIFESSKAHTLQVLILLGSQQGGSSAQPVRSIFNCLVTSSPLDLDAHTYYIETPETEPVLNTPAGHLGWRLLRAQDHLAPEAILVGEAGLSLAASPGGTRNIAVAKDTVLRKSGTDFNQTHYHVVGVLIRTEGGGTTTTMQKGWIPASEFTGLAASALATVPVDELANLYQLLGFQIRLNAHFLPSQTGLPIGPQELEDAPGWWGYERRLPVYKYAQEALMNLGEPASPGSFISDPAPEDLPAPTANPYLGVHASSVLDLGFCWHDLYGNQWKAGKPLRWQVPVRYFDPLIGINEWPALAETYRFLPLGDPATQVLLHWELLFDPSQYHVTALSQVPQVKDERQGALRQYRQIYYQVHQDDLTFTLRQTVLKDGDAYQQKPLQQNQKALVSQLVSNIHRYLYALSKASTVQQVSGQDALNTLNDLEDHYHISGKQIAESNWHVVDILPTGQDLRFNYHARLSDGTKAVQTANYTVQAGDSLQDVFDHLAGQIIDAGFVFEDLVNLLMGIDKTAAADSQPAPVALSSGISLEMPGYISLDSLGANLAITPGPVATSAFADWANSSNSFPQISAEEWAIGNQSVDDLLAEGYDLVPLLTRIAGLDTGDIPEEWINIIVNGSADPDNGEGNEDPAGGETGDNTRIIVLEEEAFDNSIRERETLYTLSRLLTRRLEEIHQRTGEQIEGMKAIQPLSDEDQAALDELTRVYPLSNRRVSVADLAILGKDETWLNGGRNYLVPPARFTMDTPFDLPSAGDSFSYPSSFAFPISVSVEMTRSDGSALYDDLKADVPEVEKVIASLSPHTTELLGNERGEHQALKAYANDFEAAFPGLKVAISKVKDPGIEGSFSGLGLMAVRLGFGGLNYSISGDQPSFMAPAPISNSLLSGLAPVPKYSPESGLSADVEEQRFDNVDLNVLLRTCFEAIEDFLDPASLAYATQLSPAEVDNIRRHKQVLATHMVEQLTFILQADHDRLSSEEKMRRIQLAQQKLAEALLTDLVAGYDIETLIQFPVSVDVAADIAGTLKTGHTPVMAGQPVNTLLTTAEEALTDDLASNDYTLSPAEVPLSEAGSFLTFFFDTPSPEKFEGLDVNLSWKMTEISYDSDVDPGSVDQRQKVWLTFIHPESALDIGAVKIPVPLRSYPIPPALVLQRAEADPDSQFNLEQIREWQYVATYEHLDVAQDTIECRIDYNTPPPTLADNTGGGEEPSGEETVADSSHPLFDAILNFITVYPQLQQDLNLLKAYSPADIEDTDSAKVHEKARITRAIAAMNSLLEALALDWGAWNQGEDPFNLGVADPHFEINEDIDPEGKTKGVEMRVDNASPVQSYPQMLLPKFRQNTTQLPFARWGGHLAMGHWDGRIISWDLNAANNPGNDDGRVLINDETGIIALGSDSVGSLWALDIYGGLRIFETAEAEPERMTLPIENDPVTATVFSRDGSLLATGHLSGAVRVWQTADLTVLANLSIGAHQINALALIPHPDNAANYILAIGNSKGLIRVADGQENGWSLRPETPVTEEDIAIHSLLITGEGQTLVAGDEWGTLSMWILGVWQGEASVIAPLFRGPVSRMVLASQQLIAGSWDQSVEILDLAALPGQIPEEDEQALEPFEGFSTPLSFHAPVSDIWTDGTQVVVSLWDGKVVHANLETFAAQVAGLAEGDLDTIYYQFTQKTEEEIAEEPVYGESDIPDRTFVLPNLDVIFEQNTWAEIWLTRNKVLLEEQETYPAFTFRTPKVRFINRVTPLLDNHVRWDLGEIEPLPDGASKTLREHLKTLFEVILPEQADQGYDIRVEARYAFALVTAPEVDDETDGQDARDLLATLPVVMGARFRVAPGTDITLDRLSDLYDNLSGELIAWKALNQPNETQARYLFRVSIFSGVEGGNLPLLKVNHVSLMLKDILDAQGGLGEE